MIPTPTEIFSRFERGEIDRDELQALMALNARELIAEMEEDYRNPVEAWIEQLLSRRLATRMSRKYGGRVVREALHALSELRDFPPARHLWNAMHPDVPLHCFFRMRRAPVFRMVFLERKGDSVHVETQHGVPGSGEIITSKFTLRRGLDWKLKAVV